MTIDWQTAIAAAAVFAAAVYLIRRGWRTITRKRTGCGACSNCPTAQDPEAKPLISLDANWKAKSSS
jgi:hypothetical protein